MLLNSLCNQFCLIYAILLQKHHRKKKNNTLSLIINAVEKMEKPSDTKIPTPKRYA